MGRWSLPVYTQSTHSTLFIGHPSCSILSLTTQHRTCAVSFSSQRTPIEPCCIEPEHCPSTARATASSSTMTLPPPPWPRHRDHVHRRAFPRLACSRKGLFEPIDCAMVSQNAWEPSRMRTASASNRHCNRAAKVRNGGLAIASYVLVFRYCASIAHSRVACTFPMSASR